MPIVPLYGHLPLRDRLLANLRRGNLPASLLLHGTRGVGKQRLALWLAQAVLCQAESRPCGVCQHCRFSLELAHPDLQWFFPRPRLKDADASARDVLDDYADARGERAAARGLYPAPDGSAGIYVATIRAIVQQASLKPALAARKVFVIGDAERMVPQEGSDQAANALLKLLEEPPASTMLVLTSSEPGALLPTIRSRVVSVRVPPVGEEDLRAFLADATVQAVLRETPLRSRATDDLVVEAAGRPGVLFGAADRSLAIAGARRMLDAAASGDRGETLRVALAQGAAKARGAFSDSLEELTRLLHARARDAAARGEDAAAIGAARAVELVEEAKMRAAGNVNPQLITAALLREISEHLP